MPQTAVCCVTCFIVEKEPGETFEGIACSRKIEKLGYRGLETVEMVYTDHRVPGENMLGDESGMGRGFNAALSALELGRINIAARAVGVARAAFEGSMEYAQHRHTFGKPIYEHQAIQFKLAGMAKLFCSEMAATVTLDAIRIHGGHGYSTEFDVERYYRDAPLMIVGEGTNEVLRNVIVKQAIGRNGLT